MVFVNFFPMMKLRLERILIGKRSLDSLSGQCEIQPQILLIPNSV